MSSNLHFSESDRKRIADAVQSAESTTSGEIIPVIVPSSANYAEVTWKAACLVIGLGIIMYEIYLLAFAGWSIGFWTSLMELPFFIVVGAVFVVVVVSFLPAAKRLLIGRTAMDVAVHNRALKAFVENEVFSTRDRTGIVILVSLFEHRVEVLGDSGINSAVQADDWSDVILLIVKGIQEGRTTDGLIQGIERCGELLLKSGVHIKEDDENELSNLPRFED
jgi:putative membrane protein